MSRSVFAQAHTVDALPLVIALAEPIRLLDWLHYEYQPWRVRYNAWSDWRAGREAHFAGAFEAKREAGALPPELEGPEPPNPGPCSWFDHATGPIVLTARQVEAVLKRCELEGIILGFQQRMAIQAIEAGHFEILLPLQHAAPNVIAVHVLGVPCALTHAVWQVATAEDARVIMRHAALNYKAPRSAMVRRLQTSQDPVRVWVGRDGAEYRPGARCTFLPAGKLYAQT